MASALIGNPALVPTDEPTAALDKGNAAEVIDPLKQLGVERGTTTLSVTHDNRIIERADRILTRGRVPVQSAPAASLYRGTNEAAGRRPAAVGQTARRFTGAPLGPLSG